MANEKNMNPVFSIKNFRSFGEEGADFELAPITVLTGCNSAGKSSMAKSLILLNKLAKTDSLKIYSGDLGLGGFDKVLHRKSIEKEIVLSHRIWSDYLQEEVVVKRYFRAKKEDILNDGYLDHYTIEKLDGTVIVYKINDRWEIEKKGYDSKKNYDSISQNLSDFSLVSEYYAYLLAEELKDGRTLLLEYVLRHIRSKETLEKQIKEKQISIEKYRVNQLHNWILWIDKRNKFIEEMAEKENTLFECALDRVVAEFSGIDNDEFDSNKRFINLVTKEVLTPWFIQNVKYINSSSAAIRRIYSVEDDNKMNVALRIMSKRLLNDREWYDVDVTDPEYNQPCWFVNRWLAKDRFDLGKVCIDKDGEGGIKVFLERDGEKRLLADEGYGITQLASLLMLIDNAIKPAETGIIPWKDGKPDCKDVYIHRPPQVICVEEPEIHLHPKYQSFLADMFVEAYKMYNIHFVIETHSEYLIRKLQVMVADKENNLTSNEVSINYVDKDENGISHNRQIKIQEDGRLSEPFGEGFYDEADTLAMELMKYKSRRK